MTHYRATFSDGTESHRNSVKRLTHAWRWKGLNAGGIKMERVGFSSSRELADKSAQSDSAFLESRPTRGKWGRAVGAEWKPGILESIEIVAAEIVK